jgi:hypothetical protein
MRITYALLDTVTPLHLSSCLCWPTLRTGSLRTSTHANPSFAKKVVLQSKGTCLCSRQFYSSVIFAYVLTLLKSS